MSRRDLIDTNRRSIVESATRHGARSIRLAAWVARGEDRPDSDVDFLVDMEAGRSLLDRANLLVELEDLLNCRLDVLNARVIKPHVRDAAVL